jgi:hypothetical protein
LAQVTALPVRPRLFHSLWTRQQLAYSLGVSKRTIRRFEIAGLPVIKRGQLRLYDAEITRGWLLDNLPEGRNDAAAVQ